MLKRVGKSSKGFSPKFTATIGLIFLSYGTYSIYKYYDFSSHSAITAGTVTEVEVHMPNSGSTSTPRPAFQPVFAYTDMNGVEQSGQTFNISDRYNFGIGTVHEIQYDTNDPSVVRMNDWFNLWGKPLIFLVIGLGIIGYSWFSSIRMRREKGAKPE